MDEYDITEAQAISYLKATDALGKYEDAITTFGDAENPTARTTTILDRFGQEGLD
jgi:hypothetical protein